VTLVERFSAGETRVELEGPDTALDGSTIYIRTTTSIGRGYEHDWGRVLQTVEDITRKKQAEDALREREAQLHDTIESLSEGLALYDANDRLVIWNSRYGEFHKSCEDLLVLGAYWPDIQRKRAERGFFALRGENLEEWIARELEQRGSAKNRELLTSDGRWFEFSHRPTQQGGFVSTWRDITEQKRAQKALEESEALLAQSAEIANLGYAVWDCVGEKYITVSDRWAGIFQYTKEEFIATFTTVEKDFDLIHPEDRDRFTAYYHEPDLDHQTSDIEYRIVRRDGEIRHVHQCDKQVFDPCGWPTRSLISIQDITERKLAEEELRKSHALYSQAEAIGKLGHWEWDVVNERLLTCSEQLARIYELTVPEALVFFSNAESELSVIHPDDRKRFEKYQRHSKKRMKASDIEFKIVTRSGAVRHIHQHSELLIDDENGAIKCFGTEQDITERKELSEKLAYQANHDALTGLINRGEFERRLGRALDRSRKSGDEHAICYLDLDQFKVINDTCGHMAGDELLRQLGQSLATSVRKRDTLARLGGDEFGVLMEHCTLAQARRVADKVCRTVAEFRFLWEERVFRIGVSIGLVPITESSGSVSNVLSAADSACYAAKDEGRNRVHVYHLDDTDLARRQREMRWVARIDQALEDERFQLWSQPIGPVMADSGEGDDFELLLRLVDERGKIILPEVFLTAAENYGLFTKLDRWVIATAFAWLGRNPKLLEGLHLCFINLSGASLTDEEFLEFVHEQLEKSQIPPRKICFEVTETAAIANLSRARTFMEALRGQGCRFALDDFGSGLSSFAYLKSLPVDYVKIDGTFVRDIVDDEVDLALVRSINDVAKVMGKWTIAESVENEAIVEKLCELGVDYAQGYAIGHPAPIEETSFSRPRSLEHRG
jgi:diguanylate cyclase (GGDEF)-like protein/PAS domain S-box-containing protein